jgi:hypothetical protein
MWPFASSVTSLAMANHGLVGKALFHCTLLHKNQVKHELNDVAIVSLEHFRW